MTDRRAFLDAIRADPDADAPRLIYADWLDEHDEADRAAFIRYQVALGGWKHDLWDEERYLRLLHRFGLVKSRRAAESTFSPFSIFARGFVERYDISTSVAVNDFDRVRELEPLPHLQFGLGVARKSLKNPGLLSALRDAPILTLNADRRDINTLKGATLQCRHLNVVLDDLLDEADYAFSGIEFPNLRSLSLGGEEFDMEGIGPAALRAMLGRFGPQLRSMKLAGVEYEDEFATFAAIEWPSGLTELDLRDWDGRLARLLIARGRLPAVERLSLQIEVSATDSATDSDLLTSWPGLAGLRHLNIGGDIADSPFMRRLAAPTPALESLRLALEPGSRLDPMAWPRLRNLSIDFPAKPSPELVRESAALACRVESLEVQQPPAEFFAVPEWQRPSALTRLRLSYLKNEDIRRAIDLPALAGLEVLDLNPEGGPTVSVVTMNALIRSPFARNLKALNLNHFAPGKTLKAVAEKHFGPRCDIHWKQD